MLCVLLKPKITENGRSLQLGEASPVSLGQWERQYYILSAEVRRLYEDLGSRFGDDFGDGSIILHNLGRNGMSINERKPMSAVGMASLLEDMWRSLTDMRLLATLDKAVRERQASEQLHDVAGLSNLGSNHGFVQELSADADGLLDMSGMAPRDIINIAWTKEAVERLRHRNTKDLLKETLLLECRPEVMKAGIGSGGKVGRPSSDLTCVCTKTCNCRVHCDVEGDTCPCTQNRNAVRRFVAGQYREWKPTHKTCDGSDQTLPSSTPGAESNKIPNMQVAAHAAALNSYIVRAFYSTSEAADMLDKQILEARRQRSDANNSDLAYVPAPRTPSRGAKDAVPLGFYNDLSGQRYPKLQTVSQGHVQEAHGSSSYSSEVPPRKPLPLPMATVKSMPVEDPFGDDSFESRPSALSPAQVTYPAIPKSQSAGLFPTISPYNGPDVSIPAKTYSDLANEAHDSIRPFSSSSSDDDDNANPTPATIIPPRPPCFSSATAPVGKFTVARTRLGSQKHSGGIDPQCLNKPQPPIPEPDPFTVPRPAPKQRYVSAGGNAKLCDREEIEGPAFISRHKISGAGMPKAELFAKLEDPAFIRANFGESAVAKMRGTSMDHERGSQDSNAVGQDGFGGGGAGRISGQQRYSSGQSRCCSQQTSPRGKLKRTSREEELVRHDKRERTQSGSSTGSASRFGKIKRAFSRKNSQSE